MAEPIVMPKVSMGQVEGMVASWQVVKGEWVEAGEPLMVIETEKATYEIEAPASGLLLTYLEPGQVVPVGTVIGHLAATQEELEELQEISPPPIPAAIPEPITITSPHIPEESAALIAAHAPPTVGHETNRKPDGKINISPVAKKKAKEHNLDITRIVGTGPNGRIVIRDIEQALANRSAYSVEASTTWQGEIVDGKRVKASIPMKGMRKTIADNVIQSHSISAPVSTTFEMDMTEIVRLRNELLDKESEFGFRITYNDIFVMILAKSINYVPIVNSSYLGDEIKIWEDINIGIAVAFEAGPYESGLIVPVVRNADQKSLAEIGRISRELIQKARTRKLTGQDVSGGTITISNVGMLVSNWMTSAPILNIHQAMILQPGAILERVVARDNQMVIRPMMPLNITFDHRIMDAVPPAKLVAKMNEYIQNPELLFLGSPPKSVESRHK